MILKTKPLSWPYTSSYTLQHSKIWPKLLTQRTKTFSPSLPFIVGGCGEAQEIAFLFLAWVPHQMRKMKKDEANVEEMWLSCESQKHLLTSHALNTANVRTVWVCRAHTLHPSFWLSVTGERGRRNVQTPSYFLISSVNGDKWTNSNNLRPEKKMQK